MSLCFLLITSSFAQVNLIPNSSFENNSQIPQSLSEFNKCEDWYAVSATPDYFSSFSNPTSTTNPCSVGVPFNFAGYQTPRTGNHYAGIFLRVIPYAPGMPLFYNYYELVGTQLNQVLSKDHIYDFRLFYSISESSGYISNQLSAYFSASQYSINTLWANPSSQLWYDTTINYIEPQINHDTTLFLIDDTLNWQELSGCFQAKGTEKFVSIGNFRDGKYIKTYLRPPFFTPLCAGNSFPNYCYLYIDDVSLYDLGYYSGNARCKSDTIICNNSSIVIGDNIRDSSTIVWQPSAGLSCTNCPNPVASPTITTTYFVTKTLCSFTSKDSITITVHTPSASATAGNFANICRNDTVTLGRNDSTFYTYYSWQPTSGLSCTNCPQPVAMPFSTTTYTLNRTECLLTTQDTVTIFVDDCEVKIPNIFTPNNDNANDEWKIKLPFGFKFTTAAVYDRWGTLVYGLEDALLRTSNSKLRTVIWDGRTNAGLECSAGVYFYVLHYEDKKGEVKKVNGAVTLIR